MVSWLLKASEGVKETVWCCFDILSFNDAYVHWFIGSSLVQVKAYHVWNCNITWTNDDSLSIGLLETIFDEVLMEMQNFPSMQMHL